MNLWVILLSIIPQRCQSGVFMRLFISLLLCCFLLFFRWVHAGGVDAYPQYPQLLDQPVESWAINIWENEALLSGQVGGRQQEIMLTLGDSSITITPSPASEVKIIIHSTAISHSPLETGNPRIDVHSALRLIRPSVISKVRKWLPGLAHWEKYHNPASEARTSSTSQSHEGASLSAHSRFGEPTPVPETLCYRG